MILKLTVLDSNSPFAGQEIYVCPTGATQKRGNLYYILDRVYLFCDERPDHPILATLTCLAGKQPFLYLEWAEPDKDGLDHEQVKVSIQEATGFPFPEY